jgi:GntR family transcriptional repressor for pyruvate dehydrogenase complex
VRYPKIRQEKLSGSVARELERMILEGLLEPGDRLPSERQLAQELNVSRPSLREALQKMEAAGLVETRHGGGTYVRNAIAASVTDPLADVFLRHPEAALDFIEFRETLDGISAYYAALRGTEDDRKILSERFEAIEAAHELDDPALEAQRDAEFHIAIAEASHNVILLHVVRGLLEWLRNDVIFNRTQLYGRPGQRDVLLEHHRLIRDAILEGDAEKARNAAQTHMRHVDRTLRDQQVRDDRADVSHRRLERYHAEKAAAGAKST